MCIIALKNHYRTPADTWRDWITNMAAANGDGGGIISLTSRGVRWEKSVNPDLDRYLALATAQDRAALHFRIGTGGGINTAMAHPFLVSQSRHKNIESGVLSRGEFLLMHNGLIYGLGRTDASDTYELVERLRPFAGSLASDMDAAAKLIANVSLASKFLLINWRGEIARAGMWQDHEGHSFSNTSYMGRFVTQVDEKDDGEYPRKWTNIFRTQSYYPQISRDWGREK